MPVARFTSSDLMKGTRVYNDGKLVGYVKRRLLADSTLAGKTEAMTTTSRSTSTSLRWGSNQRTRRRFDSSPETPSSRRLRRRSGPRTATS